MAPVVAEGRDFVGFGPLRACSRQQRSADNTEQTLAAQRIHSLKYNLDINLGRAVATEGAFRGNASQNLRMPPDFFILK